MNNDQQPDPDRKIFLAVFQQNCENLRHIKTERLLNANIYGFIVAASLSVLRGVKGAVLPELSLVFFLFVFSVMWLLTSLRLKAELEECSNRIAAMVREIGLESYAGMGASVEHFEKYPRLRSMFPLFYAFTSLCFLALLIYTLMIELGAK